jgi:hypothetical protein
MLEIQNKTSRPIRVPLPGGKTLHLGPAQSAQIADNAAEHSGIQKLVADGVIEILGEGEKPTGPTESGGGQRRTKDGTKSIRRAQGDR